MQKAAYQWQDMITLILVFGLLYTFMLSDRPLFTPDEGRYAEIAREMITSHDYLTPHLNGIKYFEKPPLFYWLTAGAIALKGATISSVRSVNVIFGVLGCLITYLAAANLFNRKTGLLSGYLLGTSLLYFIMARMVTLDLPVTFFITLTLYAFLIGCQNKEVVLRRRYFILATISAALAVLTKGLIGIILPSLIVCLFLTVKKQWLQIKTMSLPLAILVFLLIATPWHILAGIKNPEFFHFYFIEQHFLRYIQAGVGHYQPVWFFLPVLLAGFFPWIAFAPQAISSAFLQSFKSKNTHHAFFLIWFLVIFAFFSFSKSKLIPYILPCLPPLAVLTGSYLAYASDHLHKKSVMVGFLILTAITVALYYFFKHESIAPNAPTLALAYLQLKIIFLLLAIISAVTCATAYFSITRAYTLMIAAMVLFLASIQPTLKHLDTRTVITLAHIIQSAKKEGDVVVSYNQYYQDLPFYLQDKITVLNWTNELSFGMTHQIHHEWMINAPAFWSKWRSNNRLFVIMNLDDFKAFASKNPNQTIYILGNTMTNVLVSNKP